ncbi:hypothetical protein KN1_21510 [Stygiolobus caldivivus]|uniref:Uncharacterized protein n=1 Tax=Stygiolobus caldivivus TaxID=2824673 RepID=A0A8D5U8V2_9CREN|nr:hypothetical protein KN1_21510 [Stygiolobus caldivivus]
MKLLSDLYLLFFNCILLLILFFIQKCGYYTGGVVRTPYTRPLKVLADVILLWFIISANRIMPLYVFKKKELRKEV